MGVLSQYCTVIETIPYVEQKKHWMRDLLFTSLPYYITRFYVPEMQQAVCSMIKSGKYEIVFFEHLYMAQYFIPYHLTKTILDEHNVESQLFLQIGSESRKNVARIAGWWDYARIKRFERVSCQKADMVITVSENDQHSLLKLCPEVDIQVIPNGVDIHQCPFLPQDNATKNILFVGSLFYYPNLQAVHFFCENIWPLVIEKVPEAKLMIVGKESSQYQKIKSYPGVQLMGYVKDLTPYYRESALTIAPLQMGSGSRLKILESMAFGRAVISTSKGCEGLSVHDGKDIFIEDEPISFAKRIIQLLENPAIGENIAVNARSLVEKKYSWAVITTDLRSIMHQLTGEK
jgi:glycosyltransferase involved in cell wall biosynthesis